MGRIVSRARPRTISWRSEIVDQLSPAERDLLRKQDEHFLALPLNPGPDPRSMAAHLRHAVRLLSSRTAPSPCAETIGHLAAVYEQSISSTSAIACRKGCAYCCTQDVSVTTPEAIFVAAHVAQDRAAIAAVFEADAALRALKPGERLGRVRCPLLADNQCSAYAVRPLACRAFVSTSVDACISAFVDRQTPQISMPADHVATLSLVRMMLIAALRLSTLDDRTYELTAAVAALLRQDEFERRWLTGEDVLATVSPNPPIPPQFHDAIDGMVKHVRPTL